MTGIYLIRHGETVSNREHRLQGQLDTELSERGLCQAEALGHRFADIPIDAVYSSDLSRAAVTADAICRRHDLPLKTDPVLREIDMGEWAGRTLEELREMDGERLELFRRQSAEWRAPGGENFEEVRDRVSKALKELAARHDGQTIAVVTHGGCIFHGIAKLRGMSLEESRGERGLGNTAVSLLEVDGEEVRVIFRGDTSHLDQ